MIPSMVFPDTREGREQAIEMDPACEAGIWFCNDYMAADSPVHPPGCYVRNACANRRVEGNRHHNRCLVCMAGHPFLPKSGTDVLYGKDLETQKFSKAIGL